MFAVRRSNRRSFLFAAIGAAAASLLPRRGQAAGLESADRASREQRPRPIVGASNSGYQPPVAADLKAAAPDQQIASIHFAGDKYHVTTNSGATISFPEFNLRFKTDSGVRGPIRGRPVLISASMRTDRAFVVFADPGEISTFINKDTQHQTQS